MSQSYDSDAESCMESDPELDEDKYKKDFDFIVKNVFKTKEGIEEAYDHEYFQRRVLSVSEGPGLEDVPESTIRMHVICWQWAKHLQRAGVEVDPGVWQKYDCFKGLDLPQWPKNKNKKCKYDFTSSAGAESDDEEEKGVTIEDFLKRQKMPPDLQSFFQTKQITWSTKRNCPLYQEEDLKDALRKACIVYVREKYNACKAAPTRPVAFSGAGASTEEGDKVTWTRDVFPFNFLSILETCESGHLEHLKKVMRCSGGTNEDLVKKIAMLCGSEIHRKLTIPKVDGYSQYSRSAHLDTMKEIFKDLCTKHGIPIEQMETEETTDGYGNYGYGN